MKRLLTYFTLLIIAFLSACGGGDQHTVQALASFTSTLTGSDPGANTFVSSSVERQSPRVVGPVPQNGLWWNPSESGRGYAIEVVGNQILMGAYLYETNGAATWYLATLTQQSSGAYTGALNRYSGGQSLLGSYRAPTSVITVANASLTFDSSAAGSLTLQMVEGGASRTIAIKRFGFSTPPFAAPQGNFQGGMWFNPYESGRGYFIEAQGDQVIIGTFMYDSSGQPTWYTTWGTLQNGELVSGQLMSFTGGQSLNGSFKAATPAASPGNVSITLTSSSTAKLTLPNGKELSISRAVQTNVDTALSVKTGFLGDIETTQANAGTTGGDGGGGGGGDGGAGAGGGLGKVLGGLMRVVDLSDGTFIGEAITDPVQGLVTIKTGARPGPFLLTLEGRTGAKYYDEGLNQLADFGPDQVLHALVDKWDEHVGVSPLTEAAYRYALNNFRANPADVVSGKTPLAVTGNVVGLTAAQVAFANKLVLAEVNRKITTNYQLESIKSLPTPIDTTSGRNAIPNSRYGKSAVLNGGFIKASNIYNPNIIKPAITFLNDFSLDLTDGRIDGFALNGTGVKRSIGTAYDQTKLSQHLSIGSDSISSNFSFSALAPKNSLIIETLKGGPSFGTLDKNANIPYDSVTLMSDGKINVIRYNNINGISSKIQINNYLSQVKEVRLVNYQTSSIQGALSPDHTGNTFYALKYDGSVWVWGGNDYCRDSSGKIFYLSESSENFIKDPVQLANLQNIISIYENAPISRLITGGLSFGSAIALDSSGNIFKWGLSEDGKNCQEISLIGNVPNAMRMYQSDNAFFILTSDGKLFSWGYGHETGQKSPSSSIKSPTLISGLPAIIDLDVVTGNACNPGYADTCLRDQSYIRAKSVGGTWFEWGSFTRDTTAYQIAFPQTHANFTSISNASYLQMSKASSCSAVNLLLPDGSVRPWNIAKPNVEYPPLAFPPIRFMQSMSLDTLLYSFDGRTFSANSGKSFTTIEELENATNSGPSCSSGPGPGDGSAGEL